MKEEFPWILSRRLFLSVAAITCQYRTEFITAWLWNTMWMKADCVSYSYSCVYRVLKPNLSILIESFPSGYFSFLLCFGVDLGMRHATPFHDLLNFFSFQNVAEKSQAGKKYWNIFSSLARNLAGINTHMLQLFAHENEFTNRLFATLSRVFAGKSSNETQTYLSKELNLFSSAGFSNYMWQEFCV